MAWLQCEHTITKSEKTYVLRKALTTIGRAKGNDLVIDDPMISGTHASLIRKGDSYTVSLTDHTGELYINGKRSRSTALKPGDAILLGAWKMVFSEGQPQSTSSSGDDGELPFNLVENLVALSQEMMRDTSPARLFEALLKGLVRITRAEKGFVIVMQDGNRHLTASHNVEKDRLDMSRVSDSILDQVVQHRQPLIVSDAVRDSRFGRAQSVVDLKLSSVMCVPLIYRKDMLGIIYLGNDSVTDLFTERDLALLKVYSAQAALILHHALAMNQLKVDNKNLRSRLDQAAQGEMIGNCAAMKRLFQVLRRVAPTDLSALVHGETGTGKELVARELHSLSARSKGAFIAINCGAIPENLLESELFGHKKGSFTGAVSDKVGKIEAASGGTLFLDEIAEMPMNLQVKLLRVLQERVIERVGDLTPRRIDIRVIAATHQDVKELIASGRFREDLYYRLNEITLEIPPLRDREDDIGVLAQYFLNTYKARYEVKTRGFTNEALKAMRQHSWPGNVRELENLVKKAMIMSDRALLNPDDLGLKTSGKRDILPLNEAQEEFKQDYIRRVLELNNWNKAQTARDLGIDARTVFRYIEKFEAPEG
jgi:transcriptional regulator with GAF, ATPase, and Fis domain